MVISRNYLELIASSIEDWVMKEEAKYQQEKMTKELKALTFAEVTAERPSEAKSSASAVRKTGSPKKTKSRCVSIFDIVNYFQTLSAKTRTCLE